MKSELEQIHEIIMCIAECPPITDTDTNTVRAVKDMAHRINKGRSNSKMVLEALDALGVALGHCNYVWRPEERKMYETAVSICKGDDY